MLVFWASLANRRMSSILGSVGIPSVNTLCESLSPVKGATACDFFLYTQSFSLGFRIVPLLTCVVSFLFLLIGRLAARVADMLLVFLMCWVIRSPALLPPRKVLYLCMCLQRGD